MIRPALPLIIEGDGGRIVDLIRRDRLAIRDHLKTHGALLFRGFDVGGVDGLDQAVRQLSGEPLTYTEQSSPRSVIKGKVYTSTDYPPRAEIPLHNEMSYQMIWPQTLYFYCLQPPLTQGATPLASTHAVYNAIDESVREEFIGRRWMVVRNYGDDIGLRWWDAFNTKNRDEVIRYCERNNIEAQWIGTNQLRTRAVREAVHHHPATGAPVWFNHIVIFHVTSLPASVRSGLLELYGEEYLPNNTYYGDGGVIPEDVADHLRDCYRSASVRFDYRKDDLLVVDNMLVSHGREPFTGPRKIAVMMAESSDAMKE